MSSHQLFLITGATGNTGAPTVKILLEAGHLVRAFVHRVDQRSDALAALGAEIVEGDLLASHAVSSAMSGVGAAYFCYPIAPGTLLPATAIFARAASEAGVGAVVNMSQISARREAKRQAAPAPAGSLCFHNHSPAPDVLCGVAQMAMASQRRRGPASAAIRQWPSCSHLRARSGRRDRRGPADSRSARP